MIFDNFKRSVEAEMEMSANVVLIPGLVGLDQVEAIASWLSDIDRGIPFHIMGYIPVPGQSYRRPTDAEMSEAIGTCKRYLRDVHCSHLTSDEALDLTCRDDRFLVRTIA